MRRVLLALLTALVTVVGASACVVIPDSSAPQPIGEFNRSLPTDLVPTPRRSDDPETLVRNFLKASAQPDSGHQAARKFLTAGASERWDDAGDTAVLDEVRIVVDERSESAVRLRILGTSVGVLSEIGQLRAVRDEVTVPLTLTKVGNRGWRIAGDLPPGALTDLDQFDAAYRGAELYFPDRTMTSLVADPRWFYGATLNPTDVVNRLLAGPAPNLAGAVADDRQVQLVGPVAVDDDQVSVQLGGLGESDTRYRTMLAAQLIWTLAGAEVRGTYLLTADGGPLVAERAAGWQLADVKTFDPEPSSGEAALNLLRSGNLYRVASTGPVPVAGELGTGGDLREVAVSPDQQQVLAVAQSGGRQLLLRGPYGGDLTEVAAAVAFDSPTFGATAETGFALRDGQPMQWTVDPTGGFALSELDVSAVRAIDPAPITAMRVSPDGVRVALLVGGRVLLAALSTNDRGVTSLTGVYRVSYGVDSAVVAIAWGGTDWIYLAREGTEAPVMRIPLSGLPVSPLVSGNLKPPVATMAASPTSVYVGDSRGVLSLRTVGTADQYWTSVDGADAGAVPVLPGS